MSMYTVERVLFEIASGPAQAAEFKRDRQAFLAAYPLTPEEAGMLALLDVARMQARGVDPMLTMRAFTAVEGRERLGDYMGSLHAAAGKGGQ